MNRQVRHLTCSNLGLLAFGKSINDMGINVIGQCKIGVPAIIYSSVNMF